MFNSEQIKSIKQSINPRFSKWPNRLSNTNYFYVSTTTRYRSHGAQSKKKLEKGLFYMYPICERFGQLTYFDCSRWRVTHCS